MNWTLFWAAVGSCAALLGAVVALAALLMRRLERRMERLAEQNEKAREEAAEQARKQELFHEDWYGEAARPGVPARPGMMERVQGIEKELHPNGGGSLRDAVNETRAATRELRAAFDAHLRNHPTPQVPSLRVDLSPTAGPAQPLEP